MVNSLRISPARTPRSGTRSSSGRAAQRTPGRDGREHRERGGRSEWNRQRAPHRAARSSRPGRDAPERMRRGKRRERAAARSHFAPMMPPRSPQSARGTVLAHQASSAVKERVRCAIRARSDQRQREIHVRAPRHGAAERGLAGLGVAGTAPLVCDALRAIVAMMRMPRTLRGPGRRERKARSRESLRKISGRENETRRVPPGRAHRVGASSTAAGLTPRAGVAIREEKGAARFRKTTSPIGLIAAE